MSQTTLPITSSVPYECVVVAVQGGASLANSSLKPTLLEDRMNDSAALLAGLLGKGARLRIFLVSLYRPPLLCCCELCSLLTQTDDGIGDRHIHRGAVKQTRAKTPEDEMDKSTPPRTHQKPIADPLREKIYMAKTITSISWSLIYGTNEGKNKKIIISTTALFETTFCFLSPKNNVASCDPAFLSQQTHHRENLLKVNFGTAVAGQHRAYTAVKRLLHTLKT